MLLKQGITRIALAFVAILAVLIAGVGIYTVISSNNATSSTSSSSFTSSNSDTSLISSHSVTSMTTSQSALLQCGESIWATYQCDYARNGVSANEPGISSPDLKWQSPKLDGTIYAEPISAFGEVFVATENDSVYALNATTGSVIWRTNVGTPVTSGTPCGDINPLGITGTPVLDPSTQTLYFVAEVAGGNHILYGIDISSGSVIYSKDIDPPGSTPIDQQQRPALAINNGIVYVELGGLYGDCGNYHGWVVGDQLNDSSKPLYTFEVASNGSDGQGGIWEVGGASIASNGDLYIATGNSRGAQSYDYGDGVVQLSPTLEVISYFAPYNYVKLNQEDLDLGTTGPVLINNMNMVFQIGKEGIGYLMSQSNLGGINGSLFSAQVCSSAYSAVAVYNGSIYVPCTDGLHSVRLEGSPNAPSFSSGWRTDSFMSGAPIISGGAVWTIDTSNGTLFALDPSTGVTRYSYHLGSVVHFESPASAYGLILAGAGDRVIAISIST